MNTSLVEKFKVEAEAVETQVVIIKNKRLNAEVASMLEGLLLDEYINALEDADIYAREAIAIKKAGVSRAFAAIAETGTLVFDASAPDFLLSLLPEHHISVLLATSIFPTLSDFLASANKPASWILVTGPSKTADIEQVLVYGVHGPIMKSIIIVEDK